MTGQNRSESSTAASEHVRSAILWLEESGHEDYNVTEAIGCLHHALAELPQQVAGRNVTAADIARGEELAREHGWE